MLDHYSNIMILRYTLLLLILCSRVCDGQVKGSLSQVLSLRQEEPPCTAKPLRRELGADRHVQPVVLYEQAGTVVQVPPVSTPVEPIAVSAEEMFVSQMGTAVQVPQGSTAVGSVDVPAHRVSVPQRGTVVQVPHGSSSTGSVHVTAHHVPVPQKGTAVQVPQGSTDVGSVDVPAHWVPVPQTGTAAQVNQWSTQSGFVVHVPAQEVPMPQRGTVVQVPHASTGSVHVSAHSVPVPQRGTAVQVPHSSTQSGFVVRIPAQEVSVPHMGTAVQVPQGSTDVGSVDVPAQEVPVLQMGTAVLVPQGSKDVGSVDVPAQEVPVLQMGTAVLVPQGSKDVGSVDVPAQEVPVPQSTAVQVPQGSKDAGSVDVPAQEVPVPQTGTVVQVPHQSGQQTDPVVGFPTWQVLPQKGTIEVPQISISQTGINVPVRQVLVPQSLSAVVKYTPRVLARPSSVRAECREDSVLVEVERDLLGIGQLIDPSEISLGGCMVPVQQTSDRQLQIEAVLQGCGSAVMMPESLVYTFELIYTPRGIGGTPIVRTNNAVVSIECHYLRKHNVSSDALMPAWLAYHAELAAEDSLVFTLRLMTDDWQLERASSAYILGDLINIEASVDTANHLPLRVFVDSCVATLSPDAASVPSYAFVGNHGCLADAKVTGSRSQFLPRKQSEKLQMQLDSFVFWEENRRSLYITCYLKAAVASAPLNSNLKACSPSGNERWMAADGNHEVCGCCESSCGVAGEGLTAVGQALALGPVYLQDGTLPGPAVAVKQP